MSRSDLVGTRYTGVNFQPSTNLSYTTSRSIRNSNNNATSQYSGSIFPLIGDKDRGLSSLYSNRYSQSSSAYGRSSSVTRNKTREDIVRPSTRSRSKSRDTRKISTSLSNSNFKTINSTTNSRPTRKYNSTSSMDTFTSRPTRSQRVNEIDEYDASKYSEKDDYKPSHTRYLPTLDKDFSNLSMESRQTKNNQNSGKIGLKNHGNTCFMNSIVQCLSHTTELRDFCLTSKYKKYINKSSKMRGNLFEAFAEVIDKLWNSNSNVVVLLSLKSQVQKYSSKFTGYDQHDSQEFFHYLLEGLHEDINKAQPSKKNPIPDNPAWSEEKRSEETWNWYRTYDNSFIIDKFVGQLKSSLTCSVCNHVSTIFDPYWDLSLPISKKSRYSSTESIDIMQCLEDFTKEETLDGNECPTCEKCNKRRKMTKKFTIHFLPDILVLHLKRFNEGTSYRQKLSTNVSFPQCLTFNKSSIATPQSTYQLYAVSNHSGSCYGGHYTAYCKHADSGDWYQYNDSHVSQVSSSSVQSKEAYVLFYEKIQRRRSSNSSRQSSTKIIRSNY